VNCFPPSWRNSWPECLSILSQTRSESIAIPRA